MYSFVSDRFMPPDDPLGRSGPTLDNFLRTQPKKCDLPPPCPYGKKCTYGTKCKFNHPERGSGPHKSVTERLSEHHQRHLSARNANEQKKNEIGKSLSVPLNAASGDQCMGGESQRKTLVRTRSNVVTAETTNSHYGQQQYAGPYGHCPQLQPPQMAVGGTRPGWLPSGDPQQTFPKSHSVENLPCENAPGFSMPSSPSQQQLGSSGSAAYGQQQQQRSMWPHGPGSVSPSGPSEDVDGVNLHRKLHRQLTLNPSGCDPRIYQIQRGMSGMGPSSGSHSPHRPLEPTRSSHCGTGSPWDMQQSQPQQQQHHHHPQHEVSFKVKALKTQILIRLLFRTSLGSLQLLILPVHGMAA